MAFVVRRAVEFCETDMAGILHFSNFFRFMEAAEHAYLRACGLNVIMTWQGETVTFPRVSASCDYVKPARFQDVLDIEVRVEKIGRSSVQYSFAFTLDGTAIANGRMTAVLCRLREKADDAGHRSAKLEPMEIPDAIRKNFRAEGPELET